MNLADRTDPPSPFPAEEQAQRAHKSKTWRGRRSKGKGAKPPAEHHADAKTHLAKAQAASTPAASTQHLFRALSSLKQAM